MAKGDMGGNGMTAGTLGGSSSIAPPKQDQYSVMHRIMDNFGQQQGNQNGYSHYGPSPRMGMPNKFPDMMNQQPANLGMQNPMGQIAYPNIPRGGGFVDNSPIAPPGMIGGNQQPGMNTNMNPGRFVQPQGGMFSSMINQAQNQTPQKDFTGGPSLEQVYQILGINPNNLAHTM